MQHRKNASTNEAPTSANRSRLITIFVPLLVLTVFCFAYSEYRIAHHDKTDTPTTSLPTLPSTAPSTEKLPPITTDNQSSLPEVTVSSPSAPATLDDANNSGSQIPDNSSITNPQINKPVLNVLQSTIDRDLYIKYLHQSNNQ